MTMNLSLSQIFQLLFRHFPYITKIENILCDTGVEPIGKFFKPGNKEEEESLRLKTSNDRYNRLVHMFVLDIKEM